jgi:hypothetical protein
MEERRIALVGGPKSGKSWIVRTILDSCQSVSHPSESLRSVSVREGQTTITFLETPDLHSPEDVLSILKMMPIHLLCFVVNIDRSFDYLDIQMWNRAIHCFKKYQSVSLLVFTHCDRKTLRKQDELIEEFSRSQVTKFLVNFCEKGYLRMGALNLDDVHGSVTEECQRKSLIAKRIQMSLEYRKKMIEVILECKRAVWDDDFQLKVQPIVPEDGYEVGAWFLSWCGSWDVVNEWVVDNHTYL